MSKPTFRRFLMLLFIVLPLQVLPDTFDSDGVEIFYTDQGEGEAVVLIHGITMNGEAAFGATGIAASLAENYRVVTMDTRGHGASGKPHDPEAYGMQMVNDVTNLMDHLGIASANFVGYSMGGFITEKLVTTYPERAIKAIIAGAGWGDTELLVDISVATAESLETENNMDPLFIHLNPIGAPTPSPEQLAGTSQFILAANDGLALAGVTRGFGELLVSESDLRSNDVPILYIVGDLDPLRAGMGRSLGVARNVRAVTIPEVTHTSLLGHSLFLDSIQSFLIESGPNKY